MRFLDLWRVTSRDVNAPAQRGVVSSPCRKRLIALVLLSSACGVKTDIVMLDPAAPAFPPVSPDSVWIFVSPESVLLDYEPIATLHAGAGMSGTFAPEEAHVIASLQETAGGLGAHAIILGNLMGQRPAPMDGETLPAKGEATAIRFGDGQRGDLSLGGTARRLDAVQTVVLAPMVSADGNTMPESIRVGFEENIEQTLGAAGYEVLPRAIYDSIWTDYAREVGGLFDPMTGARNDERLGDVKRRTRQRLIEEHQVDGFVIPEIWTVSAPYSGTAAQWHGTEQSVIDPGTPLPVTLEVAAAVLDVLLCGDEEDPGCEPEGGLGMVAAASLMVRLENSIGADLYTGWGGIDALELVDPDTGETYPRTEDHPFGSPVRNQEAVRIALEGLLGGR